MVAATVAAQLKEIPMARAMPKRKPISRASDSKIKTRHSDKSVRQQSQSVSQPMLGSGSKKAHIIAMLRTPGGATIEAMARAAKWQPHSVRGFLAGVVRKKLGLALVSADSENGRFYRITDRSASGAA